MAKRKKKGFFESGLGYVMIFAIIALVYAAFIVMPITWSDAGFYDKSIAILSLCGVLWISERIMETMGVI